VRWDRKSLGTDVFAKGEKGMVSAQILNCRFYAFIDFDLFDAGIAFDVKDAIGNEQVVIKLLCAADVQDCVRFAIQLPNFFQWQAGCGIAS
jgi:hypothetical protein